MNNLQWQYSLFCTAFRPQAFWIRPRQNIYYNLFFCNNKQPDFNFKRYSPKVNFGNSMLLFWFLIFKLSEISLFVWITAKINSKTTNNKIRIEILTVTIRTVCVILNEFISIFFKIISAFLSFLNCSSNGVFFQVRRISGILPLSSKKKQSYNRIINIRWIKSMESLQNLTKSC